MTPSVGSPSVGLSVDATGLSLVSFVADVSENAPTIMKAKKAPTPNCHRFVPLIYGLNTPASAAKNKIMNRPADVHP